MEEYAQHLKHCNTRSENWDEARQAMADTPGDFRDDGWHIAMQEIEEKMKVCNCGLQAALDEYKRIIKSREQGYNYLMTSGPEVTAEEALKQFGFFQT